MRNIFGLLIALLLAVGAHAQAAEAKPLRGEIRALGTTLRVLQITAHPGDEDGALLLYESHGLGAQVTLLTLTRGERGDNPHGIMEPTEQGLLRTMEQLSSDVRYGVEQRFARVVDFGFARTADEVFDRWAGHNAALGDMVRVIRESRPDIIFTPFDEASPDGDGQHQATAILVREAFRGAGDAKKFPEQLSDGVEPWQAKRLFALVRSGGYSVAFNASESGAGEVESWQQQAESALGEQSSQQGAWHAPREALRHYRLIEFAPGFAMAEGAKDVAEGLNTGLASLSGTTAEAKAAGAEETPLIESRLKAMAEAAKAAEESAEDRPSCIAWIAEYLRNLDGVEERMIAAHPPAWLRAEVTAKREQAEHALLQAAGVRVEAHVAGEAQNGDAYVLVPGAGFEVHVQVEGAGVHVAGMELRPEGGRWTPRREWNVGDMHAVFRGRVPMDAPFTRPQFLLDSEEDGEYRILDERNATRALPPAPLRAIAEIEVAGEVVWVSVPVESRDAPRRMVVVAPAVSVSVQPRTRWKRSTGFSYGEIEVRVRSNLGKLQNALLSVHPPSGWRAEPEHEVLEIEGRGEEHSYRFFLVQERGGEGTFPVRAVVRWSGTVFDQGYTIVRGPDNQVAYDYRTSSGSLVSARVEVPENLEVGYVGVAGDPIPAALRDIGVKVTELDREELMTGRLGKFRAIVLGTHAVDAREDVAGARTLLLRYAEEGGVLVMLAQSEVARFSRDAPLPYALELGTARVSNAASEVKRIEALDPLFTTPNQIGNEEFRGWSEERGRCFARSWDAHFVPLLGMGDPGQTVQEGALIRTRYGRGCVTYTGLSFFRQLPAGVPGALRLLVNLLSLGAELHR